MFLSQKKTRAQRYRDPLGRYMTFALQDTDEGESIFWKQLVSVHVSIANLRGRAAGPHRLSVRQFSALLRALEEHMNATEAATLARISAPSSSSAPAAAAPPPPIPVPRKATSAQSTAGGPTPEGDPDAKECPICMDATPDVILPCAHAFCKKCLGAWSGQSSECPLCRQAAGDEDDQWVLAHEPSPAQIGAHLLRFLASLTR